MAVMMMMRVVVAVMMMTRVVVVMEVEQLVTMMISVEKPWSLSQMVSVLLMVAMMIRKFSLYKIPLFCTLI